MSYEVRADEPVTDGIRRIAVEQIDEALGHASGAAGDAERAIHEARKACKRLRALCRLARDAFEDPEAFDRENVSFRDAARALAGPRDAQVMVRTYDALARAFAKKVARAGLGGIRRRLVARRRAEAGRDPTERFAAFAATMREARERAAAWDLRGNGFEALAGGFTRTYRRGRRAFATAYDEATPVAFHEWRKEAKHHFYHVQLLEPVWPSALQRRVKDLERLTDDLGDEHDLTVFAHALGEDPAAFGDARRVAALVALIERRRDELRERARPAGKRLYRGRPRALAARIDRHWQRFAERSDE
jgi:CHAD domain-containing protein